MNNPGKRGFSIPPEQQAIRDKCFHPSGTFVEFPMEDVETSIPARFEKIVAQYPARLAVRMGDYALTYEELNRRANGVAQRILDDCGAGNRPVAILMEHGPDVLAAILGALKAGKIYVPLDPTFPAERLQFMLRGVQAESILTDDQTEPLAQEIAAGECRALNVGAPGCEGSSSNPALPLRPDTLAYIIYTSGSTGRPKGVVDNHRNVLHGTLRFTHGMHLCCEDRLSLTHPCSASASVRRIFPALLNGAALFPLDIRKSGFQKLIALLGQEAVTFFSTGRLRDFVRELDPQQTFPHLRLVSLGGEIVHSRDINLYRKIFPPSCLIAIWMSTTEPAT